LTLSVASFLILKVKKLAFIPYDHLKNFSFIYDASTDKWLLAPAYDLTYPLDVFINYLRVSRALSVNGKRHDITASDVMQIADAFTIKDAANILKETVAMTQQFRPLCEKAGILNPVIQAIEKDFLQL